MKIGEDINYEDGEVVGEEAKWTSQHVKFATNMGTQQFSASTSMKNHSGENHLIDGDKQGAHNTFLASQNYVQYYN